ncbi:MULTISPECIES: hypothetical protein [unclassified Pseudomonas]|uniref:hypothetical protein n=1 Tax=unclassified Pseudomonas TaxID=196821 RepID=UPI00131B4107|nr:MULTISPECIES: hypothetical protein [unclassified Pseudomonas]
MNTDAVFAALSRAGIDPFPWCPIESELSPKQMHRRLLRLSTAPYADGYLAISEVADLGELACSLTQLGIPDAEALVQRMARGSLRLDEEMDFLAAHMERVRSKAEGLYRVGHLRYAHVKGHIAGESDSHAYQVLELINETLDKSNLRQTTPKCVRTLAALEVAHRDSLGWKRHLPSPATLALLGAIFLVDAVTSFWTGRLTYGLPVGAVSLVLLGLAAGRRKSAAKDNALRAASRQDLMRTSQPLAGGEARPNRGDKAS